MQLVKELKGHSGCSVGLFRSNSGLVVAKTGGNNLIESANILNYLHSIGFAVPEIHNVQKNSMLMQYIHGIDMKNYLAHANIDKINHLLNFINKYIETFIDHPQQDISIPIKNKLNQIKNSCDLSGLEIDLEALYYHLPKVVPASKVIHGDFTLDNMLYHNNKFYLIDANPTDITSIYYDAGKLLQDLDCGWFIRNESNQTNYKVTCNYISSELKKRWAFLNNHYILVFMLLRILPYAKQLANREFLIREINKLWQL